MQLKGQGGSCQLAESRGRAARDVVMIWLLKTCVFCGSHWRLSGGEIQENSGLALIVLSLRYSWRGKGGLANWLNLGGVWPGIEINYVSVHLRCCVLACCAPWILGNGAVNQGGKGVK